MVEFSIMINEGDDDLEPVEVFVEAEYTEGKSHGRDGDQGYADSIEITSITDTDGLDFTEDLRDEDLDLINERIRKIYYG